MSFFFFKTHTPLKNSLLECPCFGSPTCGCSVFVLYLTDVHGLRLHFVT